MRIRVCSHETGLMLLIAVGWSCQQEGEVTIQADGDFVNSLDQGPAGDVKIQVQCRRVQGEPEANIAIRPLRKQLQEVGETVTWRMIGNNNPDGVTIRAADADHWPFAATEFSVTRDQSATSEAVDAGDGSTVPYKYTVEAACQFPGDTSIINVILDPDIVFRGGGPPDTAQGN